MAEQIRSITVHITIDTSKDTYTTGEVDCMDIESARRVVDSFFTEQGLDDVPDASIQLAVEELDAQAAVEAAEADSIRRVLNKLPADSPNYAQAMGGLEVALSTADRLRQRADQLRSL